MNLMNYEKTLEKYGKENCKNAYVMCEADGYGASGISIELFGDDYIEWEVDAMINAYRYHLHKDNINAKDELRDLAITLYVYDGDETEKELEKITEEQARQCLGKGDDFSIMDAWQELSNPKGKDA